MNKTDVTVFAAVMIVSLTGAFLLGYSAVDYEPIVEYRNVTSTVVERLITYVSATQTVTSTTTNTLLLNRTVSPAPVSYGDAKALYGVVYDAQYFLGNNGDRYTLVYLMVPNEEGMAGCCNIFVFTGFLQNIPIGSNVNITYREFYEGLERRLIATDIEVIAR